MATFQLDDPKLLPWKNGWTSLFSSVKIWLFRVPGTYIYPIKIHKNQPFIQFITWFHPSPSGQITSRPVPAGWEFPQMVVKSKGNCSPKMPEPFRFRNNIHLKTWFFRSAGRIKNSTSPNIYDGKIGRKSPVPSI